MTDSNLLPFSFPAVGRKAVTAAFDGGRLTSDGGVMLLAMAERRLGIAERLAHCFPDRRDRCASRTRWRTWCAPASWRSPAATRTPTISTLCASTRFQARLRAASRHGREPVFAADAVAVGERALAEGRDPAHVGARRSMDGLLRTGARVRHLDIDDTCDVVHGHQQLSLFNAHYDERCFLPIHVYDTERSRPVAVRAAPRQDAVGRRGARASAPARAPYPSTLDEKRASPSVATATTPARGDGMV